MVVRNEANRYLRRALEAHKGWIDEAIIIDDASTDDTPDLCEESLEGIPLRLIRNTQSMYHNEVVLRSQLWEETVRSKPEWILTLDGDEIFEPAFAEQINDILNHCEQDAVYFRLYDMWSETHYRDDPCWSAHHYYRPFMIRYRPDIEYVWRNQPAHCGRYPLTISQFSYLYHPARVQHFGWARPEDRKAKYERYMILDPDGKYNGWKEQYDSILDEHPNLLPWEE